MSDWRPFSEYGLHAAVRDMWRERRTGVFSAEVQGYEKSLYWRNGTLLFASSDDPQDKLPQVLIRQGCFTEDQFKSVEPNFKEELSVGRNLVEMGLITQQELIDGAKEQVFQVFERTINTQSGQMRYVPDELPDGMVSLPLKFPGDLFKSLMDNEDKTWISGRFGDKLDFVCSRNEDEPIDFQNIDIGDYGEAIYELIDGERDFNHLIFEAGVDEFTLFKFLYALQLLGHITITHPETGETAETAAPPPTAEDGEGEPAVTMDRDDPQIGDVRDALSDALNQEDEINKLTGMDETVALDKAQLNDQMPIKMDETVEIDRNQAGFEQGIISPEDEEDAEDDLAGDAMIQPDTALDETPDEEEEAEPEQGLDDLDDAAAFEMALGDEETPESELPFDESIEQEDTEDEDISEDEPEKDGYFSRLIRIAVALVLAGGLVLAMPTILEYVIQLQEQLAEEQVIESTPPSVDEELALMDEATDAEPDEAPVDPQPQGTELTTEPEAEVAEPEPVVKPPLQSAAQPEENRPTAEQSAETQPEEPQPVETQPEEIQPEEPAQPAEEAAEAGEATDADDTDGGLVTPQQRGFNSPIADNWTRNQPESPETQQPPQDTDANNQAEARPAQTDQASQNQQQTQREQTQTTTPQPEPSGPELVDLQPAGPEPEPEIPTPQPVDTPPTTPAATLAQATERLRAGDYAAAAQAFRQNLQSEAQRRTVALFLACQTTSIDRVREAMDDDARLFILPVQRNGQACYWVGLDRFDSRLDALRVRNTLPAEYKPASDVRRLQELFR